MIFATSVQNAVSKYLLVDLSEEGGTSVDKGKYWLSTSLLLQWHVQFPTTGRIISTQNLRGKF